MTVGQIEEVTVTFQSAQRPSGYIGGEFGNVQLQMTLTNETTDEALTLAPLPGLQASAQSLQIDGAARTATILPDGMTPTAPCGATRCGRRCCDLRRATIRFAWKRRARRASW